MSSLKDEFSRFAHSYDSYSIIQAEVATMLVSMLPEKKYRQIIDIGCGSGEVYKNVKKQQVSFEQFMALDSSAEMLYLHPSANNIQKIHADFNLDKAFEMLILKEKEKNILLSSSALQWSKDLEFTLSSLAKKSNLALFAIFTANTFKTLHETAELNSPIYTQKVLKKNIEKYYKASFETKKYRLHFTSVREMFKYIKRSGVSGGGKRLSYKQTKHLMRYYPLDYLEFEVLFVKAEPLQN